MFIGPFRTWLMLVACQHAVIDDYQIVAFKTDSTTTSKSSTIDERGNRRPLFDDFDDFRAILNREIRVRCPMREVALGIEHVIDDSYDSRNIATDVREHLERNIGGRWGVFASLNEKFVLKYISWSIAHLSFQDEPFAYCQISIGDWFVNAFVVDKNDEKCAMNMRIPPKPYLKEPAFPRVTLIKDAEDYYKLDKEEQEKLDAEERTTAAAIEKENEEVNAKEVETGLNFTKEKDRDDDEKIQLRTIAYVQQIIILSLVTALLLIALLLLGCLFKAYRKRNRRQKSETDQQEMEILLDSVGITCFARFTSDQFVSNQLIGSGQFGSVYLRDLVVNTVNGRRQKIKVACKELQGDFARDAYNETRVMASIRHLHVVSMLGYVDDGPLPVLVSEYMEGGCLRDHLNLMRDGNPPDIRKLIRFAKEAASGMVYLHSNHIIHRDLAARNCLLDSNLLLRISDFGLARRFENYKTGYESESGERFLPLYSMPIEWLRCCDNFTTEGDVWAYGVLLWEIFSLGEEPYNGMTQSELIRFLTFGRRLNQPTHCPRNMLIEI